MVNFIDVTLNLNTGLYQPYKKKTPEKSTISTVIATTLPNHYKLVERYRITPLKQLR